MKQRPGPRPVDPALRFWSKVELIPFHDCWEWTGNCTSDGYGQFNPTRKTATRAHRWAYASEHGPIPPGIVICHRCDNPRCVRPEHLFAGTPRDNTQDMIRKGRARLTAERAAAAILRNDQVRAIKDLTAWTASDLAALFGVKPRTIIAIRSGQHWRSISASPEVTVPADDSAADATALPSSPGSA